MATVSEARLGKWFDETRVTAMHANGGVWAARGGAHACHQMSHTSRLISVFRESACA